MVLPLSVKLQFDKPFGKKADSEHGSPETRG
jgi:hypothetical protein